ncbi:helix-turn-helix domain-containing protein [Pseudoalteromonas sp. 2CM41L]|uniref:helix-turn-helix domain-containing protein n=1 Tax=Pseudoalteromonas sp. 2CM41L TaxID=2929857 RepID=UPI0020BFCDFF|nr:helix-turn-helix domain-containing protein [Pseudoalteromonas sp. 2CM41L]MCK8105313.1 helix-turn-helix domain-containing protein [Pseudoalteromonas sp. 2CM41L]
MAQQGSNNAPQKSKVYTHDIDEQAHNLTQWQQKYDQVSDGRFYGCIEGVNYNDIHAFKEYTERALRQQCNIAPNSIWLGIPSQSQQSKINGLDVASNQFMCRTSSSDFELITPEQFDIYGLVIDWHSIEYMAQLQGVTIKNLSSAQSARLTVSDSSLQTARQIINSMVACKGFGLKPESQQDMLSMLALHLLQADNPQQNIAPSYKHRKAVVDKVKEYVAANPQKTITITELCELTFVSRRKLQYSFESILGINPLRFLRLTRLNNVRRELKVVGQTKPISIIAANWGFWHAGQFTKDYTQLFGENPSQTIANNLKESGLDF